MGHGSVQTVAARRTECATRKRSAMAQARPEGLAKTDNLNALRKFARKANKASTFRHYEVTFGFVREAHRIGAPRASMALQWLVNAQLMVATREKSVTRLHGVTCLAVSLNVPIDLVAVTAASAREALPPPNGDHVDKFLHAHLCAAESVSIAVQYRGGARSVAASPGFQAVLDSASRLAQTEGFVHGDSGLQGWMQLVEDKAAADATFTRHARACLEAFDSFDQGCEAFSWTSESPSRVRVRGVGGAVYTARVVLHSCVSDCGARAGFVARFLDLEPANACAEDAVALGPCVAAPPALPQFFAVESGAWARSSRCGDACLK